MPAFPNSLSVSTRTRDELLLYGVMVLALASVYGWLVLALPDLRAPARLIPFTGLMFTHAALYVFGPRLTPRRRWLPAYFVGQGALAFVINQMTSRLGTTLGLYLYLALAAQAIGLLSNRASLAAWVAALYLALAVFNFVWVWGWATLPAFLFLAAPQTFLVIGFVVLFIRQAEARKRAQALLSELETAHRQLADYATQIEDLTLVNERQRMARELHDTLAQGLAGLILQLEALDKQLAHGRPERAQTIATHAMERARTTLAEARHAIDNLRAGEGTPASLLERVREAVEHFSAVTSLPCTLDLTPSLSIPDSIQEHIVRAIAEGLANIARHARANRAWVRVAEVNNEVEIMIGDDGVGFDFAEINGRTGHYGLVGLRERARLLGGAFDVASQAGRGTTLTLRLPITERIYG